DEADLQERVAAVMAVIYLVFNEGYLSSSAELSLREELTGEAIRLGRVLRSLLPDVPEVAGLLALMLLIESRRTTRFAGGELVPLPEQDRGGWDRALIAEGHDLVRECLAIGRPGHYQLLAAINAVHTDAPTIADTDWEQVAALYDQLYAVSPGPVVALNRAVAVAELDGPEVALAEVDRLPEIAPGLTSYHAWHATRADLLRRLGRSAEARAAYDAAVAATDNPAERAYLTRRRGQLA
ncbi:MAG: RNA polymerase sigma factor, partial [Nocardioides sp.]|nr:RNA polymerase sigma factor [Nocardioides sp.]